VIKEKEEKVHEIRRIVKRKIKKAFKGSGKEDN